MDFQEATALKNEYSSLSGRPYPFSPAKVELTMEGIFIAPSNPTLFDQYINFIWREANPSDLYKNDLIDYFFSNSKVLDWDVYIKLSLKSNPVPYFLFEKLTTLIDAKQGTEEAVLA